MQINPAQYAIRDQDTGEVFVADDVRMVGNDPHIVFGGIETVVFTEDGRESGSADFYVGFMVKGKQLFCEDPSTGFIRSFAVI